MSQALENKIYIPERVCRLPVGILPISAALKELFSRHKIILIGNLQQISGEILNEIVNSSEKPFPELRHYILAIQESENNRVILISDEDGISKNEPKTGQIKAQNKGVEIILSKTIFIPLPARSWKISDVPVSDELKRKIQMSGCGKLFDLDGIKYARFFKSKSFEEKDIFELYTFLSQLQSPEVFQALEAKVKASKDKVDDEQTNELPAVKNAEFVNSVSNASRTTNRKLSDESEKIETPASLRNLPIGDLAPSEKLAALFKKMKISWLGELYGVSYYELEQQHDFDEEMLSEVRDLMKFAKKFARYTVFASGFDNIKKAALRRRENEIAERKNSGKIQTVTNSSQLKKESAEFNKPQIKYDLDKSPRLNVSLTQSFNSRISEVLDRQKSVREKNLNLPETMDFINKFLSEISSAEKEIFLDRFGGSPDERVLKFEAIADKHQTTRERVYQSYLKVLNALKTSLQNLSKDALEKLYDDCLAAVCPLTPRFLVHLTNNEYQLFQYPVSFYIRAFGIVHPKIPVLPEIRNRSVNLEANAKKLEQEIKLYLEKSHLPVSLSEIFNRLTSHGLNRENTERDFFRAVESDNFILIETDKPSELFIELRS